MDEKKIQHLMSSLDISREEAIQVIKDDEAIDKGAKLFQLDPEAEKAAKKARQGDRKISTAKPKREKKENPEKANICQAMMDGITSSFGTAEFEVVNPEREFIFVQGGVRYKVTLACPRK